MVSSLIMNGLLLFGVSSGSTGIGGLILGCFLCCGFIILPGLLSARIYIHDVAMPIEIGKGALIGLVAGLSYGVIYGFMEVVWKLFGVDTSSLFMEYYIAILESFEVSNADEAIEQMRDAQAHSGSGFGTLLINLVVAGVINVISGLAGAALFSKKFEKNIG